MPALDGLRGVAVALVVAGHVQAMLAAPTGQAAPRGIVPGGFLGVDLFFVLSGFLITALLLGEQEGRGRADLRAFYWRRALRLLPALYVMLAGFSLYVLQSDLPRGPVLRGVRDAVLYVSNWSWHWSGLDTSPALGHLWSLAVEEQFYVVWPLAVVLLLGRRRSSAVVIPVLVAAIVAVAVHRARLLGGGDSAYTLYQRTDTRIDSLLVGALLAHLKVRGLVPRRGIGTAAWAAVALYAWAVTNLDAGDDRLYRGGFTVIAVALAIVLVATVDGSWAPTRVLQLPVLRGLGRVSYGVYLWHLPIFYIAARHGAAWPVAVRIGVALTATAAMTTLSWTLVERPLARFRGRVPARHRRPKQPPPEAPDLPGGLDPVPLT